jgi:hypothetical protein
MPEHSGCGKCRYSSRGCARCNLTFVPLRARARAPCTITVVPFVRTNAARRVIAQKGTAWVLTGSARVNARTMLDVYLGEDWREPPYDAAVGGVLRLSLAENTFVVHVPDLSVTAAEVLAALKIAIKLSMGDEECFDQDSLDMVNYNRLAFNSVELPSNLPLSSYSQNVFTLTNPMLLQVYKKGA